MTVVVVVVSDEVSPKPEDVDEVVLETEVVVYSAETEAANEVNSPSGGVVSALPKLPSAA